jgi:hypothetical protein
MFSGSVVKFAMHLKSNFFKFQVAIKQIAKQKVTDWIEVGKPGFWF